MRRFFTELVAAFIMLLTLTVCHAQQLVGLPQYGVTLGGTAGDPSIVNDTSGKTILGCVVLFVAKDGGRTGIVTSYDQKGIPPGGVGFTTVHTALLAGSSGGPSPLEFQGGGFPAVEARLSAVIFDDGEVAGPDDTHMFEGLSMMRDMKVNLANILVEAHKDPTKHDTAWGQIEKFHQDSPEYEVTRLRLQAQWLTNSCLWQSTRARLRLMSGPSILLPPLDFGGQIDELHPMTAHIYRWFRQRRAWFLGLFAEVRTLRKLESEN